MRQKCATEVIVLLGMLLPALGACSATLPQPDFIEQPADGFQPVPYAPPAALAEVVPPRKDDRLVWFDGHWVWRKRGYIWKRGGWVRPPAGSHYARWQLRYRRDGGIEFAAGTWCDAQGHHLQQQPRVVIPARTPPSELTPADAPL